jgi:hypothetical protein
MEIMEIYYLHSTKQPPADIDHINPIKSTFQKKAAAFCVRFAFKTKQYTISKEDKDAALHFQVLN